MKLSDNIWNDEFPPLNLWNCPDTHKHEQWVKGRMYQTIEPRKDIMFVVYSKNNCPYCVHAKNLLKSNGMEFTEVNIDTTPEAKEFILQQGFRTVPQIYKDGVLIEGGYNGLKALAEEGKL